MSKAPKTQKRPKPDDPAEYKRFLETAKKVEASDDPKDFEHAFKKVLKGKPHAGFKSYPSR